MSGCIGRRAFHTTASKAVDVKRPKHGDIVEVTNDVFGGVRRRRWCGYCNIWTWEVWGGAFRHRRGSRTPECIEYARRAQYNRRRAAK